MNWIIVIAVILLGMMYEKLREISNTLDDLKDRFIDPEEE